MAVEDVVNDEHIWETDLIWSGEKLKRGYIYNTH